MARRDGYRYIWIDSSCIDKASSSELSEAINSMYNWYRGAQVCYAFLSDVSTSDDIGAGGSEFRRSRWFTRGWTLQELIAPRVVVFLSRDWKGLGTKDALADLISCITHINRGILTHETSLSDESVAERMRWAASRQTTRVEDGAYSLLGIFEITMPTLYGEGRYAFRRLQEEILRRIPDQSLFAWGSICLPIPQEPSDSLIANGSVSPFAPSPSSFNLSPPSGRIVRASGPKFGALEFPVEEYIHTPHGIRTQLCFIPAQAANLKVSGISQPSVGAWYLAIFSSQLTGDSERLLSKLCYIDSTKPNVDFLHVPERLQVSLPGASSGFDVLVFTVSLDDLLRAKRTELERRTVYLSHPKPSTAERRLAEPEGNRRPRLSLSPWVEDALRPYESTISNTYPTHRDGDPYSLTLFNASCNIYIQHRTMLIDRAWLSSAIVIEARVWVFLPDRNEHDQMDMAQRTPPYTSAIWTDEEPWAMTLPSRSVDLLTDLGDEVNLQLGLGLASAAHYNVRVEVSTTNATTQAVHELSTRAVSKHLSMVMERPHSDVKLIVLESVRRALKTREDVAVLETPEPDPCCSYFCSLKFSASDADPDFTIFIKYFHVLNSKDLGNTQELVVVARVTLESSSDPDSSFSGTVWQDGPYAVAWRDRTPTWQWNHEQIQVQLIAPTGEFLILHLGLDLAWQSEYYLLIDIERNASPYPRYRSPDCYDDLGGDPLRLDGPCSSINLTLPGQVKRALEAQGYGVRFDRLNGSDHLDHYHLTLSSANLTIAIDIRYPHTLTTDLIPEDSEQGTTLQARITTLFSRNRYPAETKTLEWDPWHATEGWRWELPTKHVEFVATRWTGQRLTVGLGFSLVWFSEYCLNIEVVEVNPKSSLPRPDWTIKTLGRAAVWLNLNLKRHLPTWGRPHQDVEAEDQAGQHS